MIFLWFPIIFQRGRAQPPEMAPLVRPPGKICSVIGLQLDYNMSAMGIYSDLMGIYPPVMKRGNGKSLKQKGSNGKNINIYHEGCSIVMFDYQRVPTIHNYS
jgi:hypothetical protein